ncbi:nucleotide-binding domain-containing protein [Thozetella sp. PMI_491]|nr:nucleotide-binding domain-containing protein [Thozetella sp. PMI_491]
MAETFVIAGAGIIGLNTAFVLASRGFGPRTTVVAEYLPGDTSGTYTSPWAGANFSAISGADPNALRWDQMGYAYLAKLAADAGEEAFVSRTTGVEYWDEVPHEKIKSLAGYLEEFKVIPSDKLPEGTAFGISYRTVIINAPKHLEYLYHRLQSEFGVHFIRRTLESLEAACQSPTTRVVFNCVGNAARTLPGVQDSKCSPTRGQIVLARAPHMTKSMMRHGKDYETYIIPRPGSNGNVILGGYMQKGVDDLSTYHHETQSILERTSRLSSELNAGKVEVLAQISGLRPSRDGGARVEKAELIVNGKKRVIVHNYGAGGTGYQAGYGMAEDSVRLVDDVIEALSSHQAKL